MAGIVVCIVTVDRRPDENYLGTTLRNLKRAGVWESDRLHSVHIFDSGRVYRPDDAPLRIADHWPAPALADILGTGTIVHPAAERYSGKQNCARALVRASSTDADWVLQLEDDLDVCGQFLDSMGRWIDRHATDDVPVYSFASDHATVAANVRRGEASWKEPVEYYWGNQCLLMRRETAKDIGMWFQDHPFYTHVDGRQDENAHDLELHHWAAARGVTHFRQSCPSFVQHIGFVTSVPGNAKGGKQVQFPSWPGPNWIYR